MKLYFVRQGFGSIVGVFKDPLKACAFMEALPPKKDLDGEFERVAELSCVEVETDL